MTDEQRYPDEMYERADRLRQQYQTMRPWWSASAALGALVALFLHISGWSRAWVGFLLGATAVLLLMLALVSWVIGNLPERERGN